MNLPQMPTDNLYKFMALSGVVILILSVYFPNIIGYRYVEADAKLNLEINKAIAETKFIDREINSLERLRDSYISGKTEKETLSEGKIPVIYSEDEVKRKVERIYDLKKESDIKLAEINSLNDNLKILSTYHKISRYITLATCLIGSLLAVNGFLLWYKRVQVYQDRILKRESQKGEGMSER